MNSYIMLSELKNYCVNYIQIQNGILLADGENWLKIYLPEEPNTSDYLMFELYTDSESMCAFSKDINELLDLCIDVLGEEFVKDRRSVMSFNGI